MASAPPRHRQPAPRLRGWDYRSPVPYFVTMVTAERRRVLSRIDAGVVTLSPIGRVVERCWLAIAEHLPGAGLGRFVVMPDHVHGVLALPRAGRSLSHVVRDFKAGVTREVRREGIDLEGKLWQRSFYDRIFRDPRAWWYVDRYIALNPAHWVD